MADGGIFDVVVFGFRNDLARARVLEYLDHLPAARSGPLHLAPDTAFPQRLFTALRGDDAQQLRRELETLGAQVALIAAGSELVGDRLLAAAEQRPRRDPGTRPLTLLLVVALGAAVSLWQHAPPRQPPVPRPRYAQPAAAPEEHTAPEPDPAVRFNTEAVQLASVQQFSDAVGRLEQALQLAPGDPTLTRNLQTVLLNWGIAELSAGQLDDASRHLEHAAGLGDRSEVLSALGVTYLRQADYGRAGDALDHALELESHDRNALLARAQIYLKEDKRPQALDLLQRAKEAGASGPEIDTLMQQLGREVDAEWDFVQLESRHFRVSFADDEERSAVRLVLATLEDAYDSVGRKLGSYPDEPTAVVLYTQQDFHAVTQTPDWAGAAFDGRIKIPVRGLTADDGSFSRLVRHEYAHSVIARLSGSACPVWLNEGLAVWAEEDADGERAAWAEAKIADQELFSLSQLAGSFTRLPATRAELAYAESYLAVRALIDRYGTRKLPTLLAALGRTHTMQEAFAAVYPGDFAGFERQLLQQLSG